MIIVWISLILSIALTVSVSFYIGDLNLLKIMFLLYLFIWSLYLFVDLLKLTKGKELIDDENGLAAYLFRRAGGDVYHDKVKPVWCFYRESILNIKGEGTLKVWGTFVGSIVLTSGCLCMLLMWPD